MERSQLKQAGLYLAPFLLVVSALVGVSPADAQQGAPVYTVTSVLDGADRRPGDGVCATSDGSCTLRAAIEETNAVAGPDTIAFNIPGTGPHRIELTSELPAINDRTGGTTIDGYTQPGAQPNTATYGSNAKIQIELIGLNTVAYLSGGAVDFEKSSHGLLILSAENVIRGLAITNTYVAIELREELADGNLIVGNFVGINSRAGSEGGTSFSRQGLMMRLGPDQNRIGTANVADRNVFALTRGWNIRIEHGETSQNKVQGNLVGLSPDMSRNYSVSGEIGIDLQWYTWGNLIGGTNPGEGNHVAGLNGSGIDLSHSAADNLVIGNTIGTNAAGTKVLPQTKVGWPISFKDNPVGNYVADNVLSGFEHDIWNRHNFTGGNVIVNNYLGVGRNGEYLRNPARKPIKRSVTVTGHDSIYMNNVIGNVDGPAFLVHTVDNQNHANYPSEQTLRALVSQNTMINVRAIPVDVAYSKDPSTAGSDGQNPNDLGDRDDGANTLLNSPVITATAPGKVYGRACATCLVEVYASGEAQRTSISHSVPGDDFGYIGAARSNSQGLFSLASSKITAGNLVTAVAIDSVHNTSEASPAAPVGTVNLAELGVATQSSTFRTALASEAIDGNTAGRWSDGSVSNTLSTDPQPWWQVDLGQVAAIDAVIIHERTDCCVGRLKGAYLLTSEEPFAEDASLAQLTSDPRVRHKVLSGSASPSRVTLPGPARFVRIQMPTSAALSLAEVEVLTSGLNLAHNAPTEMSSQVRSTTFTSDMAVDGADRGYSPFFAHTQGGANEWWQVDLERSSRISGVELRPRTDCCTSYMGDLTVFLSANPFGDRTIDQLKADSSIAEHRVVGMTNNPVWVPASATARYVRVQNNKVDRGFVMLSEVRVYGTARPSTAAASPVASLSQPSMPDLPPDYVSGSGTFACSFTDGTLSWTNASASAYYVWSTTAGVERYHGGFTGTSTPLPAADSYRVEHWVSGQTTARCAGPGPGPAPSAFSCSFTDGTLTWDNAGAAAYYVWSTTAGVERYHGGFTGTSAALAAADSYRVEHWVGGQTTTTCEGPGAAVFSCRYANGALTWDRAGANAYYVWSTSNGVERYHGGFTGTSASLSQADSYRVEHWNGGQTTAVC